MLLHCIAMETGQNLKYDYVLLEANDEITFSIEFFHTLLDDSWIIERLYKLAAILTPGAVTTVVSDQLVVFSTALKNNNNNKKNQLQNPVKHYFLWHTWLFEAPESSSSSAGYYGLFSLGYVNSGLVF